MGIAFFTVTPDVLLGKFQLSISAALSSAGVEVLVPRAGNASTREQNNGSINQEAKTVIWPFCHCTGWDN